MLVVLFAVVVAVGSDFNLPALLSAFFCTSPSPLWKHDGAERIIVNFVQSGGGGERVIVSIAFTRTLNASQ